VFERVQLGFSGLEQMATIHARHPRRRVGIGDLLVDDYGVYSAPNLEQSIAQQGSDSGTCLTIIPREGLDSEDQVGALVNLMAQEVTGLFRDPNLPQAHKVLSLASTVLDPTLPYLPGKYDDIANSVLELLPTSNGSLSGEEAKANFVLSAFRHLSRLAVIDGLLANGGDLLWAGLFEGKAMEILGVPIHQVKATEQSGPERLEVEVAKILNGEHIAPISVTYTYPPDASNGHAPTVVNIEGTHRQAAITAVCISQLMREGHSYEESLISACGEDLLLRHNVHLYLQGRSLNLEDLPEQKLNRLPIVVTSEPFNAVLAYEQFMRGTEVGLWTGKYYNLFLSGNGQPGFYKGGYRPTKHVTIACNSIPVVHPWKCD